MHERAWPDWDVIAQKQLNVPEDWTITIAAVNSIGVLLDEDPILKELFGEELFDEDYDEEDVIDSFATDMGPDELRYTLNNFCQRIRLPKGWLVVRMQPLGSDAGSDEYVDGFVKVS